MPLPPPALDAYRRGEFAAAEASLRRALQKTPADPDCNNLMGVVLATLSRHDQADFNFRRAIAGSPANAQFHANYGNALLLAGKHQQARERFEEAIRLHPDLDIAWLGLAPCLHHLRDNEGSLVAARKAVKLKPSDPSAYVNLASALVGAGGSANVTEAIDILRRGLLLQPGKAGMVANHLMTLHYDASRSAREIFDEHVQDGRRFAVATGITPAAPHSFTNPRDPARRLRIGYLSPDFRFHVVSTFAEGFLRAHDRAQVEVFAYMNGVPDKDSARIIEAVDHWAVVKDLSDDEVAARLRRDGIDVLVDLAGHTDGARQALLVRRAAPVQATYLGYPNTTGLPGVDYRIVDPITDPAPPPGRGELATETLVRLGRCFLQFSPPADAPPVGPLPALSRGQVTFGCFNAAGKINDPLLDLWARVLHAAPGSRLIIKNRSLSGPAFRELTIKPLAAAGVDPARIDLRGWTEAGTHHLDAYNQIDVALDSFPYTGTTTTCESLYMSAPVVSLAGDSHVSRVSASILTAVGRPHLVAASKDEYVRIAAALAADLPALAAERAGLRSALMASPVGDAAGMARALEGAYRAMWQTWCSAG
ncbi:MAG: O-linked N-acetylglucosamine transferase, SPINDLY family protein [Phycisphaerales bacterium]